jgi:hypothetical protein
VDFSTLVASYGRRDLERARTVVAQASKLRLLAVSLRVASDLGLIAVPEELGSIVGRDTVARRIAALAGQRIRCGPLPLWKRMYKELLLTQKHDRPGEQLLHLWRVSILWRLSKAARVSSRRAQRSERAP